MLQGQATNEVGRNPSIPGRQRKPKLLTVSAKQNRMASIKVFREHATHAYGCANCEKTNDHTPIIKAEAPEPLISGSLASPSAVAHIAVQKYVNVYRGGNNGYSRSLLTAPNQVPLYIQ